MPPKNAIFNHIFNMTDKWHFLVTHNAIHTILHTSSHCCTLIFDPNTPLHFHHSFHIKTIHALFAKPKYTKYVCLLLVSQDKGLIKKAQEN